MKPNAHLTYKTYAILTLDGSHKNTEKYKNILLLSRGKLHFFNYIDICLLQWNLMLNYIVLDI